VLFWLLVQKTEQRYIRTQFLRLPVTLVDQWRCCFTKPALLTTDHRRAVVRRTRTVLKSRRPRSMFFNQRAPACLFHWYRRVVRHRGVSWVVVPISTRQPIWSPNSVLNEESCEKLALRWCPRFPNSSEPWCFNVTNKLGLVGWRRHVASVRCKVSRYGILMLLVQPRRWNENPQIYELQ
jgi:hypothetical protein